jgi:hypothetical protein
MPLHKDAERLIRANLEICSQGKKPRLVVIGSLTQKQLDEINKERQTRNLLPMTSEVVFDGRHMYRSRCEDNGYTIDDVIEQIVSGMDAAAVVLAHTRMTTMTTTNPRKDKYGNTEILDQTVFECTVRHPRPELYSVIPHGDIIRPLKKAK